MHGMHGSQQNCGEIAKNCHNCHEDEEYFSELSEYSDSEDVPSENRLGHRTWDYFYMPITAVVKGLDKCDGIYRKEKNMIHKFQLKKSEAFTFKPTNTVRLTMEILYTSLISSFSIPSTDYSGNIR